jgi:hypothetical protein
LLDWRKFLRFYPGLWAAEAALAVSSVATVPMAAVRVLPLFDCASFETLFFWASTSILALGEAEVLFEAELLSF